MLPKKSKGQLEQDYKTIESTQAIPKEYIVDVESSAKKNAENNSILSKNLAENYFTELFRIKKQLLGTGDVYLPNTLTNYADSILGSLLKTEPKMKEQIKIFITRYSSPNAFCLSDGSIFINLGLIKILQNESELAFVIAHEVAHIAMQHSIKDFSKSIAIQQKENVSSGSNANDFRRLRFSRDSELEADGYALSLMNTSGYDVNMAVEVLYKLKNSNSNENIDFEKIFNNSFFTLDTAIHSKEIQTKVKEALQSRSKSNSDSKVDDLYDTHPDPDKRIASIKELMRNIKPSTIKRSESSSYSHYKTLAAFETCNNNFREQDYINTIIHSLELLKTYPENVFLLGNVSKSLYWISYYKELSKDSDLMIYGDLDQNTENYFTLYALFSRMSLKECKQISYAYLRAKEEKAKTSDALSFYLSLSAENYLGKAGAFDFYKSYLNKYPSGVYNAFVKNKLK